MRFHPRNWHEEPLIVPKVAVRHLRLKPSRPILGSFIEGVPATLVVRYAGVEHAFALADPQTVANGLTLV